MNNNIITLGIETSCDETAAAVLRGGREILSNVISTQIPLHRKFGGVVPEIASRRHIVNIMPVIEQAINDAQIKLADVDQITCGPGLVGALLVGVSTAKTLAFALDKPLIAVNHLQGHIFANFLSHQSLEPPFLSLIVSGGHSALINMNTFNDFDLIGQTRDDAAVDGYDFSFSGLKSAVLNWLNSAQMRGDVINNADVAASFQRTVVDSLIDKTIDAAKNFGLSSIVLAGGVAANSALESRLRAECERRGLKFYYPTKILCTDNAAMIACRGFYQALAGKFAAPDLNAYPALTVSD